MWNYSRPSPWLEVLAVAGIKWALVGRYTEGNRPFYGAYHFKWVVMMAVMARLSWASDKIIFTGAILPQRIV